MTSRRKQVHASQSVHLLVLTALGIVYGDIGTSPLYALREVFHGSHAIELSEQNVLGVLSMIAWALIIVISIKYLQFVMRADNKGEGGQLALTALATLQKDKKIWAQKFFLYLGLFGAAFMVADSMVTPAISVLSAVEGLKVSSSGFEILILPLAFIILTLIFYFQQYGTEKIGRFFGPIMVMWFTTIGLLGLLSIVETPSILLALNPFYALQFWFANPGLAFLSMSAVFLVVTGGEALYADMGHIGRKAIALGWYYVALPCLLLNYFGQGALLLRTPLAAANPFYLMAPQWFQIPLVVIATVATVIASQAVISGFFSMASQCIQLGYSPRLKIVHTSDEAMGQIYVPGINWLTLIGTLWLVIEFKSSTNLAAAYGISISFTMVITTILTALVAYHNWRWTWHRTFLVFAFFLFIEGLFFAANILKLPEGGWVTIVIAVVTFSLMTTWKKGRTVLYDRLRAKSYPFDSLLKDLQTLKPVRVPGSAVFMVGEPNMTPPALLHNLKHNKVLHETVIFLTVVSEDIAFVPTENRVQVYKLVDGFYRVTGHVGFSETPDVMDILNQCQSLSEGFKLDNPTFFMGREILVAGRGDEMHFWRKILFAVMARNAAPANAYFKLPLDRVIEVGMQIEI